MKARLTDGRVVQLKKDCGCSDEIHSSGAPHWLHMDHVSHELNQRLLPRVDQGDALAARAFAQEERVRLNSKLASLQQHGIEELIPEEDDKL